MPPYRSIPLLAALVLGAPPTLAQELEVEPGFVSLFDGETLTGWTTTGGRYDGHASWEVIDGAIVGRQGPRRTGGLLYTEQSYASFELRLETKLDHPFDSGVFVRMQPPETGLKGAQVTLDYRPDGQIGAVYSDGYLQQNHDGERHFVADAWNELVVRCTGFDLRIEAWLNGKRLADYSLPSGTPGFASTGLIGLQVHGARDDDGAARFRNVRIKELPMFADAFVEDLDGSVRSAAEGWQALFDGQSLDGWEVAGPAQRYVWEDDVLAFRAVGGGGQLMTVEDYTDFRLRLDFQLSTMANSGVFLRAARDGSNPAYSGCEVQLLDDHHWEKVTGSTLKPWQFTGSLYGAVPPGDRRALRPVGEWNRFELLYQGSRLAVALNGRVLYDVDTHALEVDPPFAERAAAGFIGLQHHGSRGIDAETMARFRNLYVEPLPSEE